MTVEHFKVKWAGMSLPRCSGNDNINGLIWCFSAAQPLKCCYLTCQRYFYIEIILTCFRKSNSTMRCILHTWAYLSRIPRSSHVEVKMGAPTGSSKPLDPIMQQAD